jgi:hypothetical protein
VFPQVEYALCRGDWRHGYTQAASPGLQSIRS